MTCTRSRRNPSELPLPPERGEVGRGVKTANTCRECFAISPPSPPSPLQEEGAKGCALTGALHGNGAGFMLSYFTKVLRASATNWFTLG
jgi:hypothetical protein